MTHRCILIGILFCLLVQQDIGAETLYTWIAPEGTIHITQQKPPPGKPVKDQLRYTARISPRQQIETPAQSQKEDTALLEAIRQAKQAREQADTARHIAENAIQEANQLKNETEAFLEPWRGKKRIRKAMQLQIQERIQYANQVIANAEQLIATANDAEQKAQAAENNARKIQDQFFEAYKLIVSN